MSEEVGEGDMSELRWNVSYGWMDWMVMECFLCDLNQYVCDSDVRSCPNLAVTLLFSFTIISLDLHLQLKNDGEFIYLYQHLIALNGVRIFHKLQKFNIM